MKILKRNLTLLSLIIYCLTGFACDREEEFALSVNVRDPKTQKGKKNIRVLLDNKEIGYTDKDGNFEQFVKAFPGSHSFLSISSKAANSTELDGKNKKTFLIKFLNKIQPVVINATLETEAKEFLFMVNTDFGNLPIIVDQYQVATTDKNGNQIFRYTTDQSKNITITLDGSSQFGDKGIVFKEISLPASDSIIYFKHYFSGENQESSSRVAVSFQSNATGLLYINDEEFGQVNKNPRAISLEQGNYNIKILAPGYKEFDQDLKIDSQQKAFKFNLEKTRKKLGGGNLIGVQGEQKTLERKAPPSYEKTEDSNSYDEANDQDEIPVEPILEDEKPQEIEEVKEAPTPTFNDNKANELEQDLLGEDDTQELEKTSPSPEPAIETSFKKPTPSTSSDLDELLDDPTDEPIKQAKIPSPKIEQINLKIVSNVLGNLTYNGSPLGKVDTVGKLYQVPAGEAEFTIVTSDPRVKSKIITKTVLVSSQNNFKELRIDLELKPKKITHTGTTAAEDSDEGLLDDLEDEEVEDEKSQEFGSEKNQGQAPPRKVSLSIQSQQPGTVAMGAQEYTLAEAPSLEVGSKQEVVFKPEDQDKYAPFSVPGSKLKSGTYNVVFLPYYKSIQRDFKVTGKLSKPLVSKAKNISTTEKHYFDLKLALARNFNALRKRSKAREVMEEMYRDFRPTKANPSFLLDLAIYRLQNKDFKGAISLFQKAEGYKRRFSASQRFIKFKRLYTLWSQAYEQLYYSTKNESFLRKSVQRLERLKPYARSKSPKVLKEIENKIKKLKGLGSSGKTQKEESMDLEDDF